MAGDRERVLDGPRGCHREALVPDRLASASAQSRAGAPARIVDLVHAVGERAQGPLTRHAFDHRRQPQRALVVTITCRDQT